MLTRGFAVKGNCGLAAGGSVEHDSLWSCATFSFLVAKRKREVVSFERVFSYESAISWESSSWENDSHELAEIGRNLLGETCSTISDF